MFARDVDFEVINFEVWWLFEDISLVKASCSKFVKASWRFGWFLKIITEAYCSRKIIVGVQSVDCFLEDVCLILFVISNPKGEIVGCKIRLYPRSQDGA